MIKSWPWLKNRTEQNKKSSRRGSAKAKTQARKKTQVQSQSLAWSWNPRIVITLLVIALLSSVPLLLPREEWLPITKIRLSGQFKELNTEVLEKKLEVYLGQGFFSVDIQSIQQHLSSNPWVQNVSVRRIWPNQLQVRVKEKQVIARWDEQHLLSTQAQIFEANSQPYQSLPLINGYSGQTVELLQRYQQMQQQFAVHGIQITEMREDTKGSLNLLLNNHLSVSLGAVDNELKIEHFLAVYAPQIKPRAEHIEHIDFRYSNGFAIAWKKEYLQQMGELQKRGNKNV